MLLDRPTSESLLATMRPGAYLTDGRRLFSVLRVVPEDADMETLVLLEDCRSLDSAGWSVQEIADLGLRLVVPAAHAPS